MKCISLWQPWATLIAVGAKQIETRSWATSYRGPLAIHASLKWSGDLNRMCCEEPFYTPLSEQAGFCGGKSRDQTGLPFGAVVATCILDRCILSCGGASSAFLQDGTIVTSPEIHFGDYYPGRFAWVLKNVKRLSRPIPFKGAQGLFAVSDELLTEAGAA